MPTTTQIITLPLTWSASGLIEATDGDLEVLITNTGSDIVFFWPASNATPPVARVDEGHRLWPQFGAKEDRYGITLRLGERLWLAGRRAGQTVTVTTGAT